MSAPLKLFAVKSLFPIFDEGMGKSSHTTFWLGIDAETVRRDLDIIEGIPVIEIREAAGKQS